MLGVDGVALAVQPSLAFAGWSTDFDDRLALAAQKAGEPAPVRSSPLDAESQRGPELPRPAEQRSIAGRIRSKRQFSESSSQSVECHCVMFIFVRIDPDDDCLPIKCHTGHCCCVSRSVEAAASPSGGRTGLRWDLAQSGSYQVTVRLTGELGGCAAWADRHVNARAPGRS